MMSLFAKLHPLLVHFPVGLLISGFVFEVYGKLQKEETAVEAARFNLLFGFCCALFTGAVGLLGLFGLEVKESFRSFISFHVSSAMVTFLVIGVALATRRWFMDRSWGGILYWGCLGVGVISVLATGYFGGELVHRFGVSTLRPGS